MRALETLELIENTSGSNDKLEILKSNVDDKELAELLDAALNFSRKFHVKKFEVPRPDELGLSHYDFMELLNKLESRELTGDAAVKAVENFLSNCTEQQLKWYPRILRKDLKVGFSIKTANKAGFNIPQFDVMLAKDANECKKLNEIISDGVYVSPKLDGYRCIAICNMGEVTLHSRNGVEYENFPEVAKSLSEWCESSRFILDGEIMSNDFNKMQQSAFASKRGTVVGDVTYHVFGMIPYDEWVSGTFKIPTSQRLDNLQAIFNRSPNKNNVQLVEQTLAYTMDQIAEMQSKFMDLGYEGAMALPNIPYYKGKKSNKLLKFKEMKSQDCKVTGMYEGTGRNSGRMGGLYVVQDDGVTECDVGTGFSDHDREYMWDNPDDVIGRIAEIAYQELTHLGVMRFPVFKRWRDRGDGEKI